MKVIGLTGGIGTGKSTAALYLQSKGFEVIDADQIGRDMTSDGSPVLDRLDELFGPDGPYGKAGVNILSAPGVLDRKNMASVVFSDDEARYVFNNLMFSAIIATIKDKISDFEKEECRGVIVDAPLLFESGANELCDYVILITADLEKRIERVTMRDGMTREEIISRINSQMSDEEKAPLADFVIENNGDVDTLEAQINRVLLEI